MEKEHITIFFVILICLICFYFRWETTVSPDEETKNIEINNIIQRLYQVTNEVCYKCKITLVYNILETERITYTNKIGSRNIIYLVVWNKRYSRTIDINTLVHTILSEISRITPSDLTSLLTTATDLGHYDPTSELEVVVE